MTLRNKDGSVYKLVGPNPAMKSQNFWDEYVLHNMAFDEEKAKDNTQINPIQSGMQGKESFFDALDRAKKEVETQPRQEIKVVETKTPESKAVEKTNEIKAVETKQPAVNQIDNKSDNIQKTFIHVLPAKIKEKHDSLYGDVYKIIQYESPTSFEGVILSFEDLEIKLWTNTINLQAGSILYPKNGTKRWWKVQSTEEKANGWLIYGIPSSEQPSFEL